MKYLLKNAKLLDGTTACVATDGAYITYVGAEPPTDDYDRIIDCTDRLLMPGLYNCHTHAAMTLFRGYGEDMPLDRWLHEKIFPAEDMLTSRAVYNASMLAIAEMIRGGTVSFSDMYFFCDDTARAVAETGIKANISRSITSFDPDIDMSRDHRFDEAKALYSEWNNAEDGRIKIDISLHAEYTNVPRACVEVGKFAAEHGANLHIHLSETESEHEQCKERHGGLTPAAFFEQCGCFEAPVTAAHCVWVEDGDIEILARHGATAIYNPVSNLKLGSGVMPLSRLLDGGVNVALGTDGTASNNVLDMFKEMHVGAIIQKGITRDPSRIGAGDMLRAATTAGAHAQQRGDCGEIAVGRRADIILLDLCAPNNIPYYDLRYTAVYSANSSNVTMTMVDGRILYENGEYTTVDIEKIIHDMREECGSYFKKIKNNKNLFFSGVAVLTFTNVLNKVIGMLFRIPISNILGDSGMAYFNAAYHIFVWFYMISTGGLPLAVSILVSEARFRGNREEIKRIYSLTMKMFVVIGALGSGVMILLSHQFAFLNGVAGSYLSIIAVAPTLFLVCVSSAMRGYFQGFQEMRPTAVSQIMETLGKLLMGILLALGARKLGYGLEVQAACAIAGLTIGTAFGMLFLFISKLRFHEEEYAIEEAVGGGKISGGREILRRLLVIAIPITVSSSIMSLTTMVDDMIINWRLMSIGYVEEYANALYGNYTGFAVPFANLPPALIYPISYSLIPLLKGTLTLGDSKRSAEICRSCLRVTAIVALPCTLGVSVLSEPLLKLLYNAESSELAAPKLSVLAISIFFICMLSISNAILQAYGRQNKPIISLVSGSVVKIILSFILIGIPAINIYGAPISTVVCYVICTVLNVYFMAKYTDVRPSVFVTFVKPLIASVICVGGAFGTLRLLSGHIPSKAVTLIAIVVAAIIYVIALFAIRGVERDDVLMLPKGAKIYAALQKARLVK